MIGADCAVSRGQKTENLANAHFYKDKRFTFTAFAHLYAKKNLDT
jgi:hypothetical protein